MSISVGDLIRKLEGFPVNARCYAAGDKDVWLAIRRDDDRIIGFIIPDDGQAR